MKMTEDLAYFCGLWIAEGSYDESIGRISITCGDDDVGEVLESGAVMGVKFKKSRADQWRANSYELAEAMKFLDMPMCKAPEKYLPKWAWSGKREWAMQMLSGILDGDGYVRINGSKAGYTTASERLARDIQLLLSNIGVIARLTSVESKPTLKVEVCSLQWRVEIEGLSLLILSRNIKPRIKRKAVALAAITAARERSGIPHMLPHLESIKRVFEGVKMPKLAAAIQTARRGSDLTYTTLYGVLEECKFAEPTEGYQAIKKLCAEGYYWDEIASLKEGECHTYDFTIPDTHSFWSNGFISHNTPKAYNFLHQLWALGQKEDARAWASWQFPTITSPFIPLEEIEAAREDMDEKSFNQEFNASFETMSGRVYHAFDRKVHAKRELAFDPTLPIWIGQDFNIDPMSSVVFQKQRNGELWAIDEIVLPSSNTYELCDELERRYWRYLDQITIYPDPAGAYRGHQRGESDLDIFRERGFRRQKYRRKHPPVADRVNAVNRLLMSANGSVKLYVDPRCKHFINALEQTLYVPGSREVDKKAGVEHAADAGGYCIEFEFPTRKIEILGVSL